MKKEKVIIQVEDRISELPEFIIDDILLRLDSSKDRVRMSALSKTWRARTASFPYLEFNFDEFRLGLYGTSYHDVARYLFFKYVEHCVSRFCCQQILKNLHTFKLCTLFKDKKEAGIIKKCLELILEKVVKVLDIEITRNTNLQTYRLPIGPSSSVSSLTSLKMCTELLPLSLTDDHVAALKYLKVLQFNLVSLDSHEFEHLTTSCRLLEELTVEFCSGLKKFRVSGGLYKLNKVRFFDNDGVEEIDIKAQNLRECHLFVKHVEGKGAPSMNLGSCKQLRTLHLAGSPFLTSKELSVFLSSFPSLENLSLCLRNRWDGLEVSSPSLRKIVLYTQCDLEDINMNTPNLILFMLSNAWNPCERDSGELNKSLSGESKPRMECVFLNEVDTLWFLKMWRFLRKTNRFNVLKLIHPTRITPVDFEQLKVTQWQPYELEHVELGLETIQDISVVDAVLLFCRPRSLSVISNFYSIGYKEQCHVVKFICDKLLQQDDQCHTRIEWSDAEIYMGSNSMVTTFSDQQLRETVTFINEKVLQEEENNYTVEGMQLLRLDNALN